MTALNGIAVWTGPVLLGALAMRVAAGAPDAPLLVLAAVVAPLVALLQRPTTERPHPVSAGAIVISATLILGASFVPLGDAAQLLGARRWQGVVLAAALLLLLTLSPRARSWRAGALVIGGTALVLCLVTLAATARAPWHAWRDVATRPALVFGARSPWVTSGGWFARRATLAFDEGHRIVVVEPGTFRVVEQEGTSHVVREWRLRAGDALTLRPGDRLNVEAGSRLRFEAGKRVPGAAASGAVWAEAGTAPLVASLAGVATLVLGAISLVPAAGRRGFAAPATLLALALAAACWGIYAVATVPDVLLGGSLAEPLLRLPAATSGGRALAALAAVALLALFLAAAGALHDRVTALAAARGTTVWMAAVAVAAVGSLFSLDPWLLLTAGLGFAAATIAGPRLAAGSARPRAWPVEAIGAVAGGVAFVGIVALGPRVPSALSALAESPALPAAFVSWLAVKLLRWSAPLRS
ncbi:MAG TPA: hypothetical protein VHZ49_06555 [Methylomirabilota bacterium]|nr:hypothetical protein [Methylomirabilota bacterium]